MKYYLLLLLAAQSLIAMDDRQFIRHAETGNIPALEQALRSHADVNQTDPDTEFTALHAALWNYNPEAATLLLRHNASVYKKTRDGKTARHFLAQHLGACYREGMLICKDKPCAVAWPKEFLVRMNGECFICLDKIEEIGHVYDCGHVVHKACMDISGECTICLRPHRDEPSNPSEKGNPDNLKKGTKGTFEPSELLPATVPVAPAPIPAPVAAPAAALDPATNYQVHSVIARRWNKIFNSFANESSESLPAPAPAPVAPAPIPAPVAAPAPAPVAPAPVPAPVAAPAPAPVAPAPAPDTSRQVFYNGRTRYEWQPGGGYMVAAEPLTAAQEAANREARECCRTYNQGNNK